MTFSLCMPYGSFTTEVVQFTTESSPEHYGRAGVINRASLWEQTVVSAVKFEFIPTTLCLKDQEGLLTSCQVFI